MTIDLLLQEDRSPSGTGRAQFRTHVNERRASDPNVPVTTNTTVDPHPGPPHPHWQIWWYAGPLAIIGSAFAVYHTQLQAFPAQHSSFCTTTEPCTIRYVWEFGFVSLPFMALSAFAFVITMMILTRAFSRRADAVPGHAR